MSKLLQWDAPTKLCAVDDQIANPTWARMLAGQHHVIAQGRWEAVDYLKEVAGLYHLAGGGAASRYEWAKAIIEMDPMRKEHIVKQLLPSKSNEFPTPANRPRDNRLCMSLVHSTLNIYITDWKDQLRKLW